jgi:diaminopimelate epimerase
MRINFTKMHGLGNDFIVLDGRETALPRMDRALAAALADRHTGIGCDQLIVLEPSRTADFKMRIFNQDGGEVEACGNATRAVGLLHGQPARIETAGGILLTNPSLTRMNNWHFIDVEMIAPRFDWNAIPLAYAMNTLEMPVGWDELENPSAVNVGNPHVVFFVNDCNAIPLDRLGPLIERDPLFPARINVNVATIMQNGSIRLRVWERGVGETRACGTGACATAVAAIRRKLVKRTTVSVILPGGALDITWRADDSILMTGPATESFRGSFNLAEYRNPA